MTPKKALFDAISLLGDLVIAYRTNLVVIVPKAFRTFHDQCTVHIRDLTMFTGILRVKGGGRFGATTFCFLLFSLPLPFLRLQRRQQIASVHEHAKREKKEVLEKNYFFTHCSFLSLQL